MTSYHGNPHETWQIWAAVWPRPKCSWCNVYIGPIITNIITRNIMATLMRHDKYGQQCAHVPSVALKILIVVSNPPDRPPYWRGHQPVELSLCQVSPSPQTFPTLACGQRLWHLERCRSVAVVQGNWRSAWIGFCLYKRVSSAWKTCQSCLCQGRT